MTTRAPSAPTAERATVLCDCLGYWSGKCGQPARWLVNAPFEPQTKWLECDYHAPESRRRGYVLRRFRQSSNDGSS